MKKETPQDRWQAKNTTRTVLRWMNSSDADIIAKLQSEPNRTDYIRKLIRADIESSRDVKHKPHQP